jgi:hypothetical protein
MESYHGRYSTQNLFRKMAGEDGNLAYSLRTLNPAAQAHVIDELLLL